MHVLRETPDHSLMPEPAVPGRQYPGVLVGTMEIMKRGCGHRHFRKFFHIIDSTGLSVRAVYFADALVPYVIPISPEISK